MAEDAPVLVFLAALHDEVAPAVERLGLEALEAPGGMLAYGNPEATPAHRIVVTGWGEASASAGARWSINTLKPSALVSVGYSGGTRGGIGPGSLAIGTSVVRIRRNDAPSTEEPVASDGALVSLARRVLSGAGFESHEGALGTTPVIAESAAQKSAIGLATEVVAVDLESWHSARVASHAGVPFVAVRGVVDPVEADLPGFVSKLAPGPRPPSALPAMRYVARHPIRLGSVVRTGLAALKTRRALAWFIQAYAAAWASGLKPPDAPAER